MKKKNIIIFALVVFSIGAMGFVFTDLQTNFERLVLGSANYGQDPNPTADITGQNDEQISNYTNGRWDFGAANILTTGTVGGGAGTFTALNTFDSLQVKGVGRVGAIGTGTVQPAYTQKFSVTNGLLANVFAMFNSRGTSIAKVDSVGLATVVGLTTTGAITATSQTIASGAVTSSGKSTIDSLSVPGQTYIGAVVSYLSKLSVKNGLILYAQSWFNSRGDAIGRIDSAGVSVVPTVVADTSAFTTTLLTKAIYIPGALPTDIYAVSFRSIASGVSTDALADSASLGYFAKTDTLIVQRSGVGVIVSGSKFSYIRFRMD